MTANGTTRRKGIANESIGSVLEAVAKAVRPYRTPVEANHASTPYRLLVSTLISLRTKDAVTDAASARLFAKAGTPEAMLRLTPREIEERIYPAGFYRTKARTILGVSRRLVEERGGRVPDTLDELLDLEGVGRKTANLVLTLGFGKPGICVDTHVHRIANRLGYVRTETPDETERVLRSRLPRTWWRRINGTLVVFGQRICTPLSPRCSACPVASRCPKVGVARRR
jgi:endonuclease-3